MRLLIHGMQSSGATTFARTLAERPGCVALVDIANNYAAPRVTTRADFVAKVVITTAYPLAVHVERFRPDKIVLFLRDPRDNYQSLRTKNYRNHSGLLHEKFLLLDQLFAGRAGFDGVVLYEDFVVRAPAVLDTMAALGWPIEDRYFSFTRGYDDLLNTLAAHEPQVSEAFDTVFGNSRGRQVQDKFRDKPEDPEVDRLLEDLCPRLLAFYRSLGRARPAAAR